MYFMKLVHAITEASKFDFRSQTCRPVGWKPREELMLQPKSEDNLEAEFLLSWERLDFFSQGLQLI